MTIAEALTLSTPFKYIVGHNAQRRSLGQLLFLWSRLSIRFEQELIRKCRIERQSPPWDGPFLQVLVVFGLYRCERVCRTVTMSSNTSPNHAEDCLKSGSEPEPEPEDTPGTATQRGGDDGGPSSAMAMDGDFTQSLILPRMSRQAAVVAARASPDLSAHSSSTPLCGRGSEERRSRSFSLGSEALRRRLRGVLPSLPSITGAKPVPATAEAGSADGGGRGKVGVLLQGAETQEQHDLAPPRPRPLRRTTSEIWRSTVQPQGCHRLMTTMRMMRSSSMSARRSTRVSRQSGTACRTDRRSLLSGCRSYRSTVCCAQTNHFR